MTTATPAQAPMKSKVAARLDRLPWSKFHWTVVLGLGTAWILDGLEIQIVASNGYQQDLGMSSGEVGLTGTVYLIGQVVGALFFGRLSDRLGRKKLFIITLAIYLIGSGIAGFAFAPWFLYIFRFVAGLGIGGEYTAINSAIDELIPSYYRGRVDLAINGTYWGGAALGALANLFLLNTALVPEGIGWRIGFFIGPVLGLVIIYLRRSIPESPRWQVTHGLQAEAEATVDAIEASVIASGRTLEEVPDSKAMSIVPTKSVPAKQLLHVFGRVYPRRSFLAATLMITQSFLYNAIFFTYALVLENFYGLDKSTTQYFFFPFAIGNLIGPLVLGPLFDTLGRRKMILGTYGISGVVLAISAGLFSADLLSATTQTVFWCVAFFFASAGASAGYLTMSETFPLELRGQAISYFFSIGQIAGAIAPLLYGALVGDGSDRVPLTYGYFGGAIIMIFGGVVAWYFGIDAERKSLEDVADPLSNADTGGGADGGSAGGSGKVLR